MIYKQTAAAGKGTRVKIIDDGKWILTLQSVRSGFIYLVSRVDFERYYKRSITRRKKELKKKKMLYCVCGHAQNKHGEANPVTGAWGACRVKNCDCDMWRWEGWKKRKIKRRKK